MLPVVADLLVAVPPAAAVYAATRKWPHRDPAAPRLRPEVIADNVVRHPRLSRLLRSRVDPAKETGLLLTAALVGATFCVTGVGLLVRMIHSNSGLASYDLAFARWGAHNASQISTSGLKLISLLGGYQALAVLSVVVAAVEFRRGMGRSVVPFLVLTVAGQFLVVNAVKAVVNRPRPDIARLTGFSGGVFSIRTRRRCGVLICGVLAPAWTPAVACIQGCISGGGGGHYDRRRREPGAAGRTLVHRRGGGHCHRMGLVHAYLSGLRRTYPAFRGSGGTSRSCAAIVGLTFRAAASDPLSGALSSVVTMALCG